MCRAHETSLRDSTAARRDVRRIPLLVPWCARQPFADGRVSPRAGYPGYQSLAALARTSRAAVAWRTWRAWHGGRGGRAWHGGRSAAAVAWRTWRAWHGGRSAAAVAWRTWRAWHGGRSAAAVVRGVASRGKSAGLAGSGPHRLSAMVRSQRQTPNGRTQKGPRRKIEGPFAERLLEARSSSPSKTAQSTKSLSFFRGVARSFFEASTSL